MVAAARVANPRTPDNDAPITRADEAIRMT